MGRPCLATVGKPSTWSGAPAGALGGAAYRRHTPPRSCPYLVRSVRGRGRMRPSTAACTPRANQRASAHSNAPLSSGRNVMTERDHTEELACAFSARDSYCTRCSIAAAVATAILTLGYRVSSTTDRPDDLIAGKGNRF
eukprot:scaffold2534_cov364-Prasinococcus_capsulatus_cf.AAC.12